MSHHITQKKNETQYCSRHNQFTDDAFVSIQSKPMDRSGYSYLLFTFTTRISQMIQNCLSIQQIINLPEMNESLNAVKKTQFKQIQLP